jgi:hypothetical protein
MEYGDDRDYKDYGNDRDNYNRCNCQPIEEQLRDIDTYHMSGLVLGFGLATLIRYFTSILPRNVEDWVWFGLAIVWLIPSIRVARRYRR